MRKVLFLFGQLNDDDVEWMLTAGVKRFVPAGGVLIEQGVPVEPAFILREGRLAVSLRPRRGPERELARLNAGEIVGEMSFVDARPPSATVRAAEHSTVFALSRPSSTPSWPPTRASQAAFTALWRFISRQRS